MKNSRRASRPFSGVCLLLWHPLCRGIGLAVIGVGLAAGWWAQAETGETGFYRIRSDRGSQVTNIRPDGTLEWSNDNYPAFGIIEHTRSIDPDKVNWQPFGQFSQHSYQSSLRVPIGFPGDAPSWMVPIPGGVQSGTDPDFGAYQLEMQSFLMDRFEVTKETWDMVRAWGLLHGYTDLWPGETKGTNHPVQRVNWYDVVKWCNARSEMEGRAPAYYTSAVHNAANVYRTGDVDVEADWVRQDAGYRLPTRAEWEYAARGGVASLRFPWGNEINT